MPSLWADTIQTWRDELDRVEAHQLAYVPQCQGRWEPLCGFYRVAALEDLVQYGAAGGRSLQRWLNQHPIAAIPLEDEGLLVNVNTPEDWAQWAASNDQAL
jgi:molybdopterin-guanine dinucleotide biosynthesis protein A